MRSIVGMKAVAKLITEETQEGHNTAARVGGLFEDIVDYLDSADVTSSLDITPYVTTGTRIAKFKVNGEETTIFAPSNGGSGGGGSSYDDTEIREIINELDKALDDTTALANSEKDRLDGVIADIDNNVKEKMQDAVEFAEWVQGNFPQGETGYQSGWNEKTKQFMQVVGMWDTSTDNPAVTTTKWSKLTQDVDDLYAEVTSISTGGEVTKDMVQSWIGTSVQNKIAELNLGTTYATQDDTGEIIKWLYSALKGSSSEYATFNQFVSAARNGASTAISELRTYVEQLKDGSFIANANIVSKVDDAIAELYTSASSNYAKTYIFSTIDKNSQDIATIVSAATGDSVTVDIATRFATWKAGLATKSYVDGATAGLVAANDYNAAAIVAMINDAGSSVKISADNIEFEGANLDITANSLSVQNRVDWSSSIPGYRGLTFASPNVPNVGFEVTFSRGDVSPGLVSATFGITNSYSNNTNHIGDIYQTVQSSTQSSPSYSLKHNIDGTGFLGYGIISWNNNNHSASITGSLSVGSVSTDSIEIGADALQVTDALTINTNKIVFNRLGSGQVAGGAIAWDTDGIVGDFRVTKPIINVARSYGSSPVLYPGKAKYLKIGNYYLLFLNGVLVYCDTSERALYSYATDTDVAEALSGHAYDVSL